MLIIRPKQYRIYGADAETHIREQENCDIRYTVRYYTYIYVVLGKCGDEILVTRYVKTRISYI